MNDDGSVGTETNTVSEITDAVGDLLTGVPTPVRRNAWRAFTRLCSAAVDYPVALLEGAVAEKRAESRARVRLINTSAKELAEAMHTDPEYVRAAANKFAQKIVRERVNLDRIAEIASNDLKASLESASAQEAPIEGRSISEDWLNVFEREACELSSDDMQRWFGKLLAGEISTPCTFSKQAIRLAAQLDFQTMYYFETFCSLSVSLRHDGVMDARTIPDAGHVTGESLSRWAYDRLEDYGLVRSGVDSEFSYLSAVAPGDGPFITYQNSLWKLTPKSAPIQREQVELELALRLPGKALTTAGKQLLPFVHWRETEKVTQTLLSYFDKLGFVLEPL